MGMHGFSKFRSTVHVVAVDMVSIPDGDAWVFKELDLVDTFSVLSKFQSPMGMHGFSKY